jgi:hypothetical protein
MRGAKLDDIFNSISLNFVQDKNDTIIFIKWIIIDLLIKLVLLTNKIIIIEYDRLEG